MGPYDARVPSTVLRETRGETPRSTHHTGDGQLSVSSNLTVSAT